MGYISNVDINHEPKSNMCKCQLHYERLINLVGPRWSKSALIFHLQQTFVFLLQCAVIQINKRLFFNCLSAETVEDEFDAIR